MMPEPPFQPEEQSAPAPLPWYAIDLKQQRFSKFTWRFLAVAGVVLFFCVFSIKPLWQFTWRHHLNCFSEFYSVKSATGKSYPGGAWVRSKKIIVYGAPGVSKMSVASVASGLEGLVTELGLDITIKTVPLPDDARASLQAAQKQTGDGTSFDYDAYLARRLDDRGERFGEMVVVNQTFVDPNWAWGLTRFSEGVAVLQAEKADVSLGRHEGAHLIGYDLHDDMPWYIFGYPENFNPQDRDTLMMLLPKKSDQLSDRARDALLNFWHGEEDREKLTFFTKRSDRRRPAQCN